VCSGICGFWNKYKNVKFPRKYLNIKYKYNQIYLNYKLTLVEYVFNILYCLIEIIIINDVITINNNK